MPTLLHGTDQDIYIQTNQVLLILKNILRVKCQRKPGNIKGSVKLHYIK
jgi:hypothetical protein